MVYALNPWVYSSQAVSLDANVSLFKRAQIVVEPIYWGKRWHYACRDVPATFTAALRTGCRLDGAAPVRPKPRSVIGSPAVMHVDVFAL